MFDRRRLLQKGHQIAVAAVNYNKNFTTGRQTFALKTNFFFIQFCTIFLVYLLFSVLNHHEGSFKKNIEKLCHA